jgi:hypothetical protein
VYQKIEPCRLPLKAQNSRQQGSASRYQFSSAELIKLSNQASISKYILPRLLYFYHKGMIFWSDFPKSCFMKRTKTYVLVTILLVLASEQSNAQLESGNYLIGSDITDLELGLDKGGNFSFQIDPKVAWFVVDGTAIGAYLNFGLSTAKDAGTDISYGIGALGRYYFPKEEVTLIRQTRFFLEGNVGIEGDNPATGDNTNGLGLGVGPGLAYFVTPNIGLEALFKYNGIIGFGSAVTSNNLNLSIGFQIYLPSAKLREKRDEMKKESQ